jgi:rhodanese-related sulfurtransferase
MVLGLALATGLGLNFSQILSVLHPVTPSVTTNYSPRPVELPFVKLWSQQDKLIVDARSLDNYLAGHIAAAHSVPAGDQIQLQKLVACCLNRGSVVVYCSSITCADSFNVGEALFGAGFSDIYLYAAGFADWLQHQQPVVIGMEGKL